MGFKFLAITILVYKFHFTSSECNLCNSLSGFACFSVTQYFGCNKTTGAINLTRLFTCTNGTTCDDSTLTNLLPCSTTTASCDLNEFPVYQKFNATVYCSSKPVGRYQHPDDSTCKQYVNCFRNNGTKGAVYNCSGSTIFNPYYGICDYEYVCGN